MERDLRITGKLRGQSGNAEAPKGFEVSNPWRVGSRLYQRLCGDADSATDREENFLEKKPILNLFCSSLSKSYPYTCCFLNCIVQYYEPDSQLGMNSRRYLRNQALDPLDLFFLEMQAKPCCQVVDPVIFGFQCLKNLRLATDPPFDLVSGKGELAFDFFFLRI